MLYQESHEICGSFFKIYIAKYLYTYANIKLFVSFD